MKDKEVRERLYAIVDDLNDTIDELEKLNYKVTLKFIVAGKAQETIVSANISNKEI